MTMSDPTYPVFPVFAFLGFVLVLVPLPWHLQVWNAGTCLYMIWTSLACLNLFINSIVWHGNAINFAPVWCDISTRFFVGSAVAIPSASLCINRRLYKIASAQTASISRAQKRRAVIEDLAVGLGIPILEMALQYVVSGHRFNIFEDIGCYPATINVWLTYLLVGSWPVVLGLISGCYCVMTLRSFSKRHTQFDQFLSSNSALTVHRYFRLMALATTELLCTTPLAAYTIYLNLTTDSVVPYRGWSDLHFNYSQVDQIPSVLWRSNHQTVVSLELSRWLFVVCALVFFMFFGFAEEARKHYRNVFWTVAKLLRISPRTYPSSIRASPRPRNLFNKECNLPVFLSPPIPAIKRDSLGSLFSKRSDDISSLPSPDTSSIGEKPESYVECLGHAY